MQRLSLLALELERLGYDPSDVGSRLEALHLQAIDIGKDLQGLSQNGLVQLRYLGVVAGIKGWCMEFAERQRIDVNFRNDVSSAVPLEVGLCLLRILQEALNNAAKHSGTKRIEVRWTEPSGEIHLIISDSGPVSTWKRQSMAEVWALRVCRSESDWYMDRLRLTRSRWVERASTFVSRLTQKRLLNEWLVKGTLAE